jgi:hypothetical protein
LADREKGILLNPDEFRILVKKIRLIASRWRGLDTMSTCRQSHSTEDDKTACSRCTPKNWDKSESREKSQSQKQRKSYTPPPVPRTPPVIFDQISAERRRAIAANYPKTLFGVSQQSIGLPQASSTITPGPEVPETDSDTDSDFEILAASPPIKKKRPGLKK